MFRTVKPLFSPQSVAIVGASESGGGGWPRAIYQNLEDAGFPARIYLINPNRNELWGRKVYPNFASLPEPIDLALTIIPAEAINETLAEGLVHGLKCALIYAARFGEGGDEAGAARAKALRALCDQGLRVSGPNCMGSLSLNENLLFYPAPRVRGLPKGSVGVVFQSGGTFQFWLQQAGMRGLGFTYAVSSGNELDLDLADYINALVLDERTRLIVCMVEGVHRPEAFMAAAAKALAAGKPILVIKIGRSERGRASTMSHTGALAGDDAVFDAVCRKYGVVRSLTLDDLIETALAFQSGRLPRGRRVGMTGFSGGAKGLFLDDAAEAGLEFAALAPATMAALASRIDPGVKPDNPLDCGAGLAARPQLFAEITRIVADDPSVDIIAVQGQLPIGPEEKFDPAHFAGLARATDKPLIAWGRLGQNVTDTGRAFQIAAGIPFIQGLPETARALRALIDYAARQRAGTPAMPPSGGKKESLAGAAFAALLAAHGLTPPRATMATTTRDVGAAAERLGFPVALKIVSPQALHKTELGGVALNLTSATAVTAEAEAMAHRLRRAHAGAAIEGFLIQEMVAGVELLIGVREDAQFGPVMVAGLGGILVEAIGDVALRLLPVDEDEAKAMLSELKGRAILGPFRGRAPRDEAAIARAMAGLSRIFLDHRPHLTDLEINPLIALEDGHGVRAVDVRVVRRG